MAGGMSRRGGGLPLGQRTAAPDPPPAEPEAELEPRLPRFCYVDDGRNSRPGVLLEWRQAADAWEGRVAYGVASVAGVRLVEQWVAASHLRPA